VWKDCTKCGQIKPFYKFRKHKLGRFGLQPSCTKCECEYQKNNNDKAAERVRKYRRRHPDRVKLQQRVYNTMLLEKDPNYFRNWRLNNRDKCREAERRYSRNNPSKIAAKAARRRAKRKNQTASLTYREKNMVQILYNKAHVLGDGYVVDHILPISHGGGDHPYNLQIITAEENSVKFNKLNYIVKGFRICWIDDKLVVELAAGGNLSPVFLKELEMLIND
jgi:hypothetical protein